MLRCGDGYVARLVVRSLRPVVLMLVYDLHVAAELINMDLALILLTDDTAIGIQPLDTAVAYLCFAVLILHDIAVLDMLPSTAVLQDEIAVTLCRFPVVLGPCIEICGIETLENRVWRNKADVGGGRTCLHLHIPIDLYITPLVHGNNIAIAVQLGVDVRLARRVDIERRCTAGDNLAAADAELSSIDDNAARCRYIDHTVDRKTCRAIIALKVNPLVFRLDLDGVCRIARILDVEICVALCAVTDQMDTVVMRLDRRRAERVHRECAAIHENARGLISTPLTGLCTGIALAGVDRERMSIHIDIAVFALAPEDAGKIIAAVFIMRLDRVVRQTWREREIALEIVGGTRADPLCIPMRLLRRRALPCTFCDLLAAGGRWWCGGCFRLLDTALPIGLERNITHIDGGGRGSQSLGDHRLALEILLAACGIVVELACQGVQRLVDLFLVRRIDILSIRHHRDGRTYGSLFDMRIARRIVQGLCAVARMRIEELCCTGVVVNGQRSAVLLENRAILRRQMCHMTPVMTAVIRITYRLVLPTCTIRKKQTRVCTPFRAVGILVRIDQPFEVGTLRIQCRTKDRILPINRHISFDLHIALCGYRFYAIPIDCCIDISLTRCTNGHGSACIALGDDASATDTDFAACPRIDEKIALLFKIDKAFDVNKPIFCTNDRRLFTCCGIANLHSMIRVIVIGNDDFAGCIAFSRNIDSTHRTTGAGDIDVYAARVLDLHGVSYDRNTGGKRAGCSVVCQCMKGQFMTFHINVHPVRCLITQENIAAKISFQV